MANCNICNSGNTKSLRKIKSHYFSESQEVFYTLFNCLDCGSNFFDPQENSSRVSLDEMYDKIDNDNKSFAPEFSPSKTWQMLKTIIEKSLGHKPKVVLDVGCRTGDFLMHLNSDCRKVGVELSDVASDVAKKRGLEIYTDFVEDIQFDTEFDIVTAFAVLEHLQRPNKFLDSLQNWVKKDGICVVLIPTHECLKEKMASGTGQTWRMYTPPSHLNFYSRAWLDGYFEKAGFDLEKRFFTSGGAFNPLSKIPILGKLFKIFMFVIDMSPLNRLPIFDHQYSIYRKR